MATTWCCTSNANLRTIKRVNFEVLFIIFAHKKIPLCLSGGGFWNNELAMTYSHMGNPTLPSALRGFTSEFGKGSGGSLLLWSPAQLV